MNNKLNILFVEDIPLDAEIICRAISRERISFDRRIVENEEEFIKELKSYTPDIIISDYSLPRFDGMTALTIRNKIAPETPFILVTGSINESIAIECMRSGADDYIIKKNLSRLGQAIRSAIEKKETRKKKDFAESELKESYEFIKSILKTIPFGIDIVDETGTVLFQSDNFREKFGPEAIGMKCWELYRDDKKQCSDCPLTKGIITGKTESYESHGIMGGRIFDISHTGMIYKGKKAMLEIFQDITDRKEIEEKIRKSEAYYKALTDLSPDGILIADHEGRVKYVSNRIHEIFEIPTQQNLLGQSIFKWVSPEFHEPVRRRITDLLIDGISPEAREYKLLRDSGDEFWGEISSTVIPGKNGVPDGLLIVCRDVTQRKRIADELFKAKDKAEESDRLKTAFLQNMSHEIRTPLNAIVGFSALLTDTSADPETRNSYNEVIMNSSNHLLTLLNDILEVANIDAGTVKIDLKPVELNSFLRTLYNQFKNKINSENVCFTLETALTDDDSVVVTDMIRLQGIIANLISNAIKFTSKGYIRFGYSTNEDSIEIYIKDTGIGIDEQFHNKIFDRFYQIEAPENKLYEGLGLGLSIANSYARMLGGEIYLDSAPGKGSSFYLSLPFVKPEKLNGKDLSSPAVEGFRFPEKKTILIAEDVESNFMLIKYFLKGINAEILYAANGKEAVDMCLNNKVIDLVLMDVRMPVMDGFTATRMIKEMKPEIPVIIQTAYASDKDNARITGSDGFITKPFDQGKLLKTIKQVTSHNL